MPSSPVQFVLLLLPVFLVLAGCFGVKPIVAQEREAGPALERGSKACPPHKGSNVPRPNGRDATPAERAAFLELMRRSPTGRTIIDQFSISMAQAAAKRQNSTRLSHDPQHGNQVTFNTPDGHTYLWYPGNAVVLKGTWRACEDRFGMTKGGETTMIPFGKLCFKYGPATYNPATGAKGDEWECAAASKLEATLVEQRQGDVFGLVKRAAVPYVLPREKTTMTQLLARMPR